MFDNFYFTTVMYVKLSKCHVHMLVCIRQIKYEKHVCNNANINNARNVGNETLASAVARSAALVWCGISCILRQKCVSVRKIFSRSYCCCCCCTQYHQPLA